MSMLGIKNDLKTFAKSAIGCYPKDVHFHSSQQDEYGRKTCIQTDAPIFGDMQPQSGTTTPADSYFTNNFLHTIDKTFSLQGSFQQSISISNTISTSFTASASFSVEEGVEGIAKATETFSISATVSASSTHTETDTNTMTTTETQEVNVNPGECIHAGINLETLKYDIRYTVNQKTTEFFFANYEDSCSGHHYWFVNLYYYPQQSKLSRSVEGIIRSQVGTTYRGFAEKC